MPQRYVCRIAINRVRNVILMVLLFALLAPAAPAHAAPPTQADPAAQCAEGVRLADAGDAASALPLLEAGFAGRERANFADTNDLGLCALGLGYLYHQEGELDNALSAYAVALRAFRQSGNQKDEGTTLNGIGVVYTQQGNFSGALDFLDQALIIWRANDDRYGESTTLNNIGQVYAEQGRYAEAMRVYRQAQAIRSASGDDVGEAEIISNIAGVFYYQGRYAEALDAFQQVLLVMRTMGNRSGEGTILTNIGVIYANQGRSTEALKSFQQALSIHQEVGNRLMEATTRSNIGEVFRAQGMYAQALDAFQQALEIWREAGDRHGEGTTLNNIGLAYSFQGRYAEAQNFIERALVIMREIGDRAGEGISLNNLGGVFKAQGRSAEALESYQQALVIHHEIGNRLMEGITHNNLGESYSVQGRFIEALNSYHQALDILQSVGDRTNEGTVLNNLGQIYINQKQYTKALTALQQALIIAREVGNRANEGTILNNIGQVYANQRQYTEAEDFYNQAVSLSHTLGDLAGEVTSLNNLGVIYQEQGQLDRAVEYYQQALTILHKTGNQNSVSALLNNLGIIYSRQEQYPEALKYYQQALTLVREVGNQPAEAIVLSNIAFTIYDAQGRTAEALEYYQQAIDVLEEVRAQAGDDQGRAGFITQHANDYERAALLYHQQGDDAQAFLTVERGRARAFLDSLATGTVELADDAANDLLQREREAHARRQTAQDALIRARALTDPDVELVADLEAQLAEAEQAYAAVQAEIAGRGDQLAELVSARKDTIPSLRDLQEDIPADTTLVSYLVGEDSSLAFVVTNSSLRAVELPVGREQLSTQMIALHSFDVAEATTSRLATFYDQLITPLALDPSAAHLMIIPHGVLHYLPFAALAPADGPLLGDQFTLSLLPATGVLPFIQRSLPAGTALPQVVALANPAGPPPVPGVVEAAETIGTLFATEPVVGASATVPALRAAAPQAHILHLGAHGIFSPTIPLDSHIQLTPAGDDDGRLTVSQVYGLNLRRTALVVLSACETQVNQLNIDSPLVVTAGDELVGLQRAFLYAGAQNVVTTLWQVPDAASARLMERFYTHLRRGLAPADALQQAQQDIRAEYPNPRDWAGFVLTGLGTTPLVTLPWWQQIPWWAWTLGAGGLLLLAGGLWWRRGRKEGME